MPRSIVALVLATLLLSTAGSVRAAAATSWTVYHNALFGYSVSYPSTWLRATTPNTEFAVHTGDNGAGFVAAAAQQVQRMTAYDLRRAVDSVIYKTGGSDAVARHRPIEYTTRLLNGVTFTEGSISFASSDGRAGTLTALATYRPHALYVFGSILLTAVNGAPRPAAAAQAAALARTMASITVTGPTDR